MLELEPLSTIHDILEFLKSERLLKQPINSIEVKFNRNIVENSMSLKMLVATQPSKALILQLQAKKPEGTHILSPPFKIDQPKH